MSEEQQMQTKLIELETEHRDLDDAIRSMEDGVYVDQIQLKRLKKKKLKLKDTIARMRSSLIPDVSACSIYDLEPLPPPFGRGSWGRST